MQETQTIMDMARRVRRNCRICGERVEREEPCYMDGYQTVHLDCFFAEAAEGGAEA